MTGLSEATTTHFVRQSSHQAAVIIVRVETWDAGGPGHPLAGRWAIE